MEILETKILKIDENNSPEDLRKFIERSVHNDQLFFVQIRNIDLFMLLRHACYYQFQLDKNFMETCFEDIKNQLKEVKE